MLTGLWFYVLLLSPILLNLPHSSNLLTLILLKSIPRHLIKTDSRLVRILDKHILAIRIRFLHDHVDESAHDRPAVVQIQIHLRGELARLVAQDAEDDVVGGVLGGRAGDESMITLAYVLYEVV